MVTRKKTHLEFGQFCEQAVCQHLQQQGLLMIEKNYRCRMGEIDLIMQHKECLVFIEVRFRQQQSYGSSAETVDFRKQQKLIRCASHYLQKHRLTDQKACRFDVVGVKLNAAKILQFQWIQNAFQA